jgi:hypothetical protein
MGKAGRVEALSLEVSVADESGCLLCCEKAGATVARTITTSRRACFIFLLIVIESFEGRKTIKSFPYSAKGFAKMP